MSKYCRPMGLYVTYLGCMECEDKQMCELTERRTRGHEKGLPLSRHRS